MARQDTGKSGLRFKDLIMRDYKDEKELEIIEVGQKRTHQQYEEDVFQKAQKRKR